MYKFVKKYSAGTHSDGDIVVNTTANGLEIGEIQSGALVSLAEIHSTYKSPDDIELNHTNLGSSTLGASALKDYLLTMFNGVTNIGTIDIYNLPKFTLTRHITIPDMRTLKALYVLLYNQLKVTMDDWNKQMNYYELNLDHTFSDFFNLDSYAINKDCILIITLEDSDGNKLVFNYMHKYDNELVDLSELDPSLVCIVIDNVMFIKSNDRYTFKKVIVYD